MKLILQHDERDCGAACLAMLVAHYGKRLPLSRFCELTRTDRSGASLYGLASGAEQLGFAARALSGDLPGLLQELRAGTIRCPFIAHIVTEDNMLHYVVVYGLSGNRLRIADPGKENIRCTPTRSPQAGRDTFSRWRKQTPLSPERKRRAALRTFLHF